MRSVMIAVCVDLRHFFSVAPNKIEHGLKELREGYYPSFGMTSMEFGTWLLGIGGYAGLFGSLAIFYLFPAFPRTYLPVLFTVPILSAAGLYGFFKGLYLVLWFVVKVLEAMLNEHITVVLISSTFIIGQAALIGYVVYKNAFINNLVLNNAVDAEEEEQEQEQEELQPEDYEDADDGADADDEAAPLNSVPPVANNTPSTATPLVPPMCVDCDDDCTKCMPGLMSLDAVTAPTGLSGEVIASKETPAVTGLSGELPANVICENGVCRLANGVTSSQAWKDMLVEESLRTKEGVKID